MPSALDITDERVVALFEGSSAAVATQVEAAKVLIGAVAVEAAIWDEVRARPIESRAVVPSALLDRLRAELDPYGVFAVP